MLAHVDTVTDLPNLLEPASVATMSLVSESETLLKWEVPVNPSGGWMTIFLRKTAAPAVRERRIMVASSNVVKRMTGKSDQHLRTPRPPGPWSISRAGAPVPGGAAAGRRQ